MPQTPAPPLNQSARPLILVVDDEEGIRGAMVNFLEDEGFAVRAAANALEALDLIADSEIRPALIMLDLMMPVMDGWEFCKLRQGVRILRDIPVLAVSAGSMVGDREPASVDATLAKPFDPDQLAWLAARMVSRKSLLDLGGSPLSRKGR
jgi:CheY-like chemotaxis protein